MSLKQAADELLKIADEIEAQADEATQFVCKDCNHTSTIAKINAKREEIAKTAGEKVTVSKISVNDQVSCPACGGVMSYTPTEASEKFYFDPKTAEDKKEEKEDDDKTASSEPIDYDSYQRYTK